MAIYNGTMSVNGTLYDSTAQGYQIGGNVNGSGANADASITLPDTYAIYQVCTIRCTMYASLAPAQWSSNWNCWVSAHKNGYPLTGLYSITGNTFANEGTWPQFNFELQGENSTFKAGDTISIQFGGVAGTYIDADASRCCYLKSADFYSVNATTNNYLRVKSTGQILYANGKPLSVKKK